MDIKQFPPVGTRPTEKTLDSQEANQEANTPAAKAKNVLAAPKDVFEQAKSSTIDQLLPKPKAQALKNKQLESMGVCAQRGRDATAGKKLEVTANCITFRTEVAGSCIPMKKLEPVADCEPGTRTIDRLKQQQLLPAEKPLTKPEK